MISTSCEESTQSEVCKQMVLIVDITEIRMINSFGTTWWVSE